MDQKDKAYYLKDIELSLLLSVKGMKELYGIKMDNIENPDQLLVYQTLFELEKKKLIYVNKGNVMIYKELDEILEDISSAEKILLYSNRYSEYPDQCIYLSGRAVAVSAYGAVRGMNRIESISLSYLPEKICECGFYIEELISDQSLFEKADINNAELKTRADILFAKESILLSETEWGTITNCLRLFSLNNRKCMKQYLLVRDQLKDYFLVTDEQTSLIYSYSKKRVIDILEKDLLK